MRDCKILLADDHPIVLNGMVQFFQKMPGISIVGKVSELEKLKKCCSEAEADLLVLDINFDGVRSLDLIPDLRLRCKSMKILIFSSYNDQETIKEAMSYDINGYLCKSAKVEEWEEALEVICNGDDYFPDLSELLDKTNHDRQLTEKQKLFSSLSSREKEIADLVVSGLSEREIASSLFLSKHTVHEHKRNLMKKLGVRSSLELVVFMYELNNPQ